MRRWGWMRCGEAARRVPVLRTATSRRCLGLSESAEPHTLQVSRCWATTTTASAPSPASRVATPQRRRGRPPRTANNPARVPKPVAVATPPPCDAAVPAVDVPALLQEWAHVCENDQDVRQTLGETWVEVALWTLDGDAGQQCAHLLGVLRDDAAASCPRLHAFLRTDATRVARSSRTPTSPAHGHTHNAHIVQVMTPHQAQAWLAATPTASHVWSLLHLLATAAAGNDGVRDRYEQLLTAVKDTLATASRAPPPTSPSTRAALSCALTRVTLYVLWYGVCRVPTRGRGATESGRWLRPFMAALLDDVVAPLLECGVGVDAVRLDATDTAVQRVVELAVLSLAVDATQLAWPESEDGPHTQRTAQWRRAGAALYDDLTSWLGRRVANATTDTCAVWRDALYDALDAVRLVRALATALPFQCTAGVERGCEGVLREVCRAASTTTPAVVTEVLCQPGLARRLARLRREDGAGSGVFYEQACTSVFAAAAAWVESSKAALAALLKWCETARDALLGTRAVSSVAARPYLHSPPTQMCYALLCVGYDPAALLQSPLCPGNHYVELLQVCASAGQFHRDFATRADALPAFVRTGLVDAVRREAQRCLRALPVRPTSDSTTPSCLATLTLTNCLSAGARVTASARRTLHRGNDLTDPTVLPQRVSYVVYVAVHGLVESVLRGDQSTVTALTLALGPLLERMGLERGGAGAGVYYVELADTVLREVQTRGASIGTREVRERRGWWGAAEVTATRWGTRRRHVSLDSTLDAESGTKTTHGDTTWHTSVAMEACLSEFAALLVPRLSQAMSLVLPASVHPDGRASVDVVARPEVAAITAQDVHTLRARVLEFSAYMVLCGMRKNTAAQLVSVNAALLKAAAASGGPRDDLDRITRINDWLTLLEKRQLSVGRAPQSVAARTMAIATTELATVHLMSTAMATRGLVTSASLDDVGRDCVVAVLRLLSRLTTHYAVQAEPVSLRQFRTARLDPALTHLLETDLARATTALSLSMLTAMATIMCVQRTAHYVSAKFYECLTRAVERIAGSGQGGDAARLLCATAVLCQRPEERFGQLFLRQLDVLEGRLSASETTRVLGTLLELPVPLSADPVLRLVRRLVRRLSHYLGVQDQHDTAPIAVSEVVTMLQTLVDYDAAARAVPVRVTVPFAAVLQRLMNEKDTDGRLALRAGECGVVVRVVAHLQTTNTSDSTTLQELPRRLALHVLARDARAIAPWELPLLVCGYACVPDSTLRTHALRSFIARTLHACPALSSRELVRCVEAYAGSGIDHPHLFGLLLARVVEVRQEFSLELALRLLRAGTQPGCGAAVRTTCLTAAEPIFINLVRHVVQSDPDLLASVASVSVTILHALRECFPHHPISAAVLENLTQYHHAAGMEVTAAALQLMEARGAADYAALRVLSEHTIAHLLPHCGPTALADLVHLLVRCGVRSGALLEGIRVHAGRVMDEMTITALVQLAKALLRACVEVDAETMRRCMRRICCLVTPSATPHADKDAASPEHVSTLLLLLHATSHAELAALRRDTIAALLDYLQRMVCATTTTAPTLSVTDISAVLRACTQDVAEPRAYARLVTYCADALQRQPRDPAAPTVDVTQGGVAASSGVTLGRADVVLLVQLVDYLVQLGQASHGAVAGLLGLLYDKRSVLLQRHTLLETTRHALSVAGETAHPDLYALVVEGKLL